MIKSKVASISLLIFLFFRCGDDSPGGTAVPGEVSALYNLMNEWYFWKDQLAQGYDLHTFSSSYELLDSMIYSELDRFSYIKDKAEYDQYFSAGQYEGFGFSMRAVDNEIYTTKVYSDSPIGSKGVKRGWRILEIDGQFIDGLEKAYSLLKTTNTFRMINHESDTLEFVLTKSTVNINTVLDSQVIPSTIGNIGYLVFDAFLETSKSELDKSFAEFETEGIKTLVLDLRYNGGGRLDVANYLGNKLVPSSSTGKVLTQLKYHESKSSNDIFYYFEKDGSLDLNEIVIITTESTASASELIVTGLEPFMKVTLIGTGSTYGKPVGQNSWSYDDRLIFAFVTFNYVNSLGEGSFYDGIPSDLISCDNIKFDFGDPNEIMLKDAIMYLETGTVSNCPSISSRQNNQILKLEGLQREIGAF